MRQAATRQAAVAFALGFGGSGILFAGAVDAVPTLMTFVLLVGSVWPADQRPSRRHAAIGSPT